MSPKTTPSAASVSARRPAIRSVSGIRTYVPAVSYLQAIVIALVQGVTELFPISSLGHSVLVPAWIGGSWKDLVTQGDAKNGTPYLAFVVALHVATALALLGYYWRDWRDIIIGFFQTLRTPRIETPT